MGNDFCTQVSTTPIIGLRKTSFFSDFCQVLCDILMNVATPLTVGVFGPWGSGKTSLLRMLQQDIDVKKLPRYRTVWFTAWKYGQEEALWRAFILRVVDALYPHESDLQCRSGSLQCYLRRYGD